MFLICEQTAILRVQFIHNHRCVVSVFQIAKISLTIFYGIPEDLNFFPQVYLCQKTISNVINFLF